MGDRQLLLYCTCYARRTKIRGCLHSHQEPRSKTNTITYRYIYPIRGLNNKIPLQHGNCRGRIRKCFVHYILRYINGKSFENVPYKFTVQRGNYQAKVSIKKQKNNPGKMVVKKI
jgi:hypothetical protein